MIEILSRWYHRHFSNPQIVILAILLFSGFAIVVFLGDILVPLLASIVIAYLLEALVLQLEKYGMRRIFAVLLVFSSFVTLLGLSTIGFVPLLSEQIIQFIEELPRMVSRLQQVLLQLPMHYPHFISEEQIKDVVRSLGSELGTFGQTVLSFSISSLKGVITWLVYLILTILLVFFFLKDKKELIVWLVRYIPNERDLVKLIWHEMDQQIGNYIRGKIVEILIVGVASFIVFVYMGLNYAVLLGLLVGLSVLVPFVGATVVTIPVALIAFFQWGWSSEFAYLMLAYGIIQALDGNVLVPLLFSEAVNLHPVAIIISIILFGGIWGFWGVFFAIPLATLVKAVLNAWPQFSVSDKAPALP